MSIYTSYTNARANLKKLLDEVTFNNEVVIISRKKSEDVALISANELSSLLETHHLLKSPKNAERLLKALKRAQSSKLSPQSIDDLRIEVGLDEKK
jgi:antitoxin YefM